MKFHNKIVFLTAASTGIGRATAVAFAKEGAQVLLVARTEERLQETKRLVEEAGGQSDILVADLSNISSIDKLIRTVVLKYKTIDALCNIAGIWHGKEEVYAGKDYETFSEQVILDTLSSTQFFRQTTETSFSHIVM